MQLPKWLMMQPVNKRGHMGIINEEHGDISEKDLRFMEREPRNIIYHLPTKTVFKQVEDFDAHHPSLTIPARNRVKAGGFNYD
jgi:hypothetical protein